MVRQITINNKTYILKYTLRNLFVFEEIAGRSFNAEKLADWVLWFYSTLYANNKGFDILFDDFVSLCDEHPELFKEFKQFIIDCTQIEEQKATNRPVVDEVKKKRTGRVKK